MKTILCSIAILVITLKIILNAIWLDARIMVSVRPSHMLLDDYFCP